MGYHSRHFRKIQRRLAAAALATSATASAVAAPEEPAQEPEVLAAVGGLTVPSWTVSAPNRPALTVRAETETAARKAARESWGLARLPNGTSVAAV